MKKIIFTVTNDLSYDQRMRRICGTLAANGYSITLVGRKLASSPPLTDTGYRQKRIRCWFNKGRMFYAEYNFRLFFYLLFRKADAICAIDLDTIMACYQAARLKGAIRIYDAHELFTEMKEVISRPRIHNVWLNIEKKYVPRFRHGYTVSDSIAAEFNKRYGVQYGCIRNVPVLRDMEPAVPGEKFILYQGAVNEARGFEQLIPAMQQVDCRMIICGDGNFMPQLKELIRKYGLEQKIELKGMLPPEELWTLAQKAFAGVAIAEKEGLNQYLALPNKFFDYLHAGVPQVTMDFPEYRAINSEYEVAVLIGEPDAAHIAAALNLLLGDAVVHARLRKNCLEARKAFNWQKEEKKLIAFYQAIFNH